MWCPLGVNRICLSKWWGKWHQQVFLFYHRLPYMCLWDLFWKLELGRSMFCWFVVTVVLLTGGTENLTALCGCWAPTSVSLGWLPLPHKCLTCVVDDGFCRDLNITFASFRGTSGSCYSGVDMSLNALAVFSEGVIQHSSSSAGAATLSSAV